LPLLKRDLSQEGLIRRRIKVFLWPLPSWVRPKWITKRCDRHAKQDTVRQKFVWVWRLNQKDLDQVQLGCGGIKIVSHNFYTASRVGSERTLKTSDGEERTNW